MSFYLLGTKLEAKSKFKGKASIWRSNGPICNVGQIWCQKCEHGRHKDLKANRKDFILEDSILFYSIRIINIKIIIMIIQI